MRIDERRPRRPARDCLESERAASREEIEYRRAREFWSEDIQPRFSHPLGGGPYPSILGNLKPPPTPPSTDNARHEPAGVSATARACSIARPFHSFSSSLNAASIDVPPKLANLSAHPNAMVSSIRA